MSAETRDKIKTAFPIFKWIIGGVLVVGIYVFNLELEHLKAENTNAQQNKEIESLERTFTMFSQTQKDMLSEQRLTKDAVIGLKEPFNRLAIIVDRIDEEQREMGTRIAVLERQVNDRDK